MDSDESLVELVSHWFGQFGRASGPVSVHQIRTLVNGDPVPEGPHRDGYQYVGVFVVSRVNVAPGSALTTVWNESTDEKLVSDVRMEPGTLLSFDDRKVVHDVGPVAPEASSFPGYRDVLILTFPDHGYVAEHGEVATDEEVSL